MTSQCLIGCGNYSGKERKAYAKCITRMELLEEFGHELRRPQAAPLRDGIYELRARFGNVNYRILYFFQGKNACVLAHACTKEKEVPDADIDRALRRKESFENDPGKHTYEEEE